MNFEFGNLPSRAHELFHKLETQGASYVEALVEAQKSEELFLDYKRISTSLDAKSLHDSDRTNLRKALSGFANSEGGVILWGLETGKNNGVEAPKLPDGYADAARFVSLLEDAISGCTIPPVPGVRSIKIPLDPEGKKGLVATLIPGSLIAPHQTTDDSRAYFMRAGSSFQRVPHGVLAGMFGRRPSPKTELTIKPSACWADVRFHNKAIYVSIDLELENCSSVIARNAYITWSAKQSFFHNSVGKAFLLNPGSSWHVNTADSRNGSVIAEENNRLAPYSRSRVLGIEWVIPVREHEELDIDIYFGCDAAAPNYHRLFVCNENLLGCFEELKKTAERGFSETRENLRIAKNMLGTKWRKTDF